MTEFYGSMITAGSILFGFCGTFLAFKIQREASYFRQPVGDFNKQEIRDASPETGALTHFSSAFLLLIVATIATATFGFILPLFALAAQPHTPSLVKPGIIVGGLVGALILLGAYFITELVHYKILSNRLIHDKAERGKEQPIVFVGFVFAVIAGLVAYLLTG